MYNIHIYSYDRIFWINYEIGDSSELSSQTAIIFLCLGVHKLPGAVKGQSSLDSTLW